MAVEETDKPARPVTKPVQTPTVGRILHYRLSAADVDTIQRRRAAFQNTQSASVVAPQGSDPLKQPGYQAHVGYPPEFGQTLPLIVTKVHSDTCVNGQIILDGNDQYHVSSGSEGTEPGTWAWPPRS